MELNRIDMNPGRRRWLALAISVLVMLGLGARAATWTVNMSNFQFAPKDLTVSVGDTVTWVNQDFAQHDTTSGVNGVPNGIWHSPLLGRGGSFSFTFNLAPGVYPYYCTPHVFTFNMVGSITVVAPNQPPSVAITNPLNGSSFTVGTPIQVQASASDSDGSVSRVDFFANGAPAGSSAGPAFATTLNNLPAGNYALTAVAVDNSGATTTSAPVNISVVPGNVAPSVTITNPVNGALFFAGDNVVVQATAEDSDGRVTQVQFRLNGTVVGTSSAPPFSVVLTNLAVGSYTLSATATDDLGATGESAPVSISVVVPTSSPQIQTPPQSQQVLVGTNVLLSVLASGTEPLSYQWRFNDSDISGGTATRLNLLNVQLTNTGFYSVLVTNALGSVTSAPAFLEVIEASNAPPTVNLISPTNGSIFPLNQIINLAADAHDPDGSVTQVVFSIRSSLPPTNAILIPAIAPFVAAISNLPAGIFFAAAKAIDNRGATGTSAEISFTVQAPPVVVLSRFPTNEAVPLGEQITVTVTTVGPASAITNVALFEEGNMLASGTAVPFSFIWRPGIGTHAISAQVIDQLGQLTVSELLIVTVFTPETVRPTLVITNAPRNFGRFHQPGISIGGTAGDAQLKKVEYQINDGLPLPARGLERWLIETNLVPGMNVIRVRSVDLAGNFSFEATRFLTLVVTTTIVVTTQGDGTVTPDLNSQPVEIGQVYKIKAQPGPGNIFAGWQGVSLVDSNSSVLNFTMVEGLTNLVAVFTNNPFSEAAGTFNGLFFDTNRVSTETLGAISLRLQKSGAFSGKVSMNGSSYPYRGQFTAGQSATVPVVRRTLSPIVLSLKLEAEAQRIFGFVTNAVGPDLIASALRLERDPFSARTNAAPFAGVYLFALNETDMPGVTVGNGGARVAVDGTVKSIGALADGSKFTFSSTVSRTGEIPFYWFMPGTATVFAGWVGLGADRAINGELFSVRAGTNSPVHLQTRP